jgi:hypothetical protein
MSGFLLGLSIIAWLCFEVLMVVVMAACVIGLVSLVDWTEDAKIIVARRPQR